MIIIINNVDDSEPMTVMGDFNEDVVNHKSVLAQFMRNNKFHQFVNSATSNRGATIDLVFARNRSVYCW